MAHTRPVRLVVACSLPASRGGRPGLALVEPSVVIEQRYRAVLTLSCWLGDRITGAPVKHQVGTGVSSIYRDRTNVVGAVDARVILDAR
jgi:hypothetical protein